jgi:DNA (cytosine-5)-methyltransferase 1
MRCIELFAGAGGAALGLEAAGVHHLALVERDPDACAVLRAAGLGPVVEADVRDLDTIQSVAGPSCDLLWSSWPCQPFSSAGLRMGAQDKRNGWPWTVDAIDRFQPAWFMGENVRGLLSHTGICPQPHPEPDRCPRCYFDAIIMGDLRARFAHVGWWLLDAADFGVPQHRRRVIVWAGPAPLTPPAPTHGPGMFTRPWMSMGEALGLSSGRVVGGGRNPQRRELAHTRNFRDLTDEPSTTVAATQVGNAGPWVVAAGETGAGMPRHVSESAPTIGTKGTAYLLRPAPTVAAGSTGSACGQLSADAEARRRRLTVEECARLQDFPAGYPWEAARTKTSRYRCVGNAVPPTLARVVGERLMEVAGT